MTQSVWYFPGDPPVPDLTAILGLVVAMVGAVLVGTFYLARRRPRRALRAAFLASLPGFLIAGPGLVVIAHRHFGAWQEVRTAIQQHDAAISRDSVPGHVLTEVEFATLRAKHLPRPIPLHFHGWDQPVYLRMAHGVSPYVGVDFGGGAHAAFDPVTMLCTYSD